MSHQVRDNAWCNSSCCSCHVHVHVHGVLQATDTAAGTSIEPNGLVAGEPQYEGTVVPVAAAEALAANVTIPVVYWCVAATLTSCGILLEKQCSWCHAFTVKVCPFLMLSVFWGLLLGKGEVAHWCRESVFTNGFLT